MNFGQNSLFSSTTNNIRLKFLTAGWSILNYQAIPGHDQNATPTNQKTAGSKLDQTS